MRKPEKISVTFRSETGGVFDYKEYPATVIVEGEPFGGATEVWIDTGLAMEKLLAAPGGTIEIAAC